ncbi:putative ABC transporter permease [Dehalobacter sp. DCM]|uniref:putative ABC transporter permease n=1 Tax=Dehalobacter sp. DCM TaxID=2907827 RepID=UPI003081FC2C|nr:putative ABC transporter permease [Dehalobacter sp. DCM]
MVKWLSLFFIMGMMYFTLEGFFRGWANISMLFVGGTAAALVGQLNQYPKYYSLKIWQQCLIGTGIVLVIEFISGMVLNAWLGLGIWDYSSQWGNIYGQICPKFALIWFCLMPFNIWLDDWLRLKLYREGEHYSLTEIYQELVTGK